MIFKRDFEWIYARFIPQALRKGRLAKLFAVLFAQVDKYTNALQYLFDGTVKASQLEFTKISIMAYLGRSCRFFDSSEAGVLTVCPQISQDLAPVLLPAGTAGSSDCRLPVVLPVKSARKVLIMPFPEASDIEVKAISAIRPAGVSLSFGFDHERRWDASSETILANSEYHFANG